MRPYTPTDIPTRSGVLPSSSPHVGGEDRQHQVEPEHAQGEERGEARHHRALARREVRAILVRVRPDVETAWGENTEWGAFRASAILDAYV